MIRPSKQEKLAMVIWGPGLIHPHMDCESIAQTRPPKGPPWSGRSKHGPAGCRARPNAPAAWRKKKKTQLRGQTGASLFLSFPPIGVLAFVSAANITFVVQLPPNGLGPCGLVVKGQVPILPSTITKGSNHQTTKTTNSGGT